MYIAVFFFKITIIKRTSLSNDYIHKKKKV